MLEIAGRSILVLSCRFYLVIIQYITKLDTEKLRGLVRDLLPEDVITAVDEVKQQIIDGEIVVPNDQASFEAAHGEVYELD